MSTSTLSAIVFGPFLSWCGIACWAGVIRFKYLPLLLLGSGYLLWAVCVLLLWRTTLLPPLERSFSPVIILLVLGATCIFGFRLVFYDTMRQRGISPKRIFGFGAR
jgi:hypothetical protein